MGKKISKKNLITIITIILGLIVAISFFFNSIQFLEINKEFIKFLIAITLSMAGFGIVAFQLGKENDELKDNLLNFSIMMVCGGLAGIAYIAYPGSEWMNFNWGRLSALFFIWGTFHLLAILIEERFIKKIIP
ncbi:MAG: hypothetical protein PVJ67_02825 [Candidatus Pacearchaeota archaeon]|jgi:hypothetical protein